MPERKESARGGWNHGSVPLSVGAEVGVRPAKAARVRWAYVREAVRPSVGPGPPTRRPNAALW